MNSTYIHSFMNSIYIQSTINSIYIQSTINSIYIHSTILICVVFVHHVEFVQPGASIDAMSDVSKKW